jgi:hypothetical protein
MKPIALFYFTVFFKPDGGAWPLSGPTIQRDMKAIDDSGLSDAASYFLAGINGGQESEVYAKCYLPKAQHLFTGLDCMTQNLIHEAMRLWCIDHPGWNVFTFHSKSLAHDQPLHEPYKAFEAGWVACMTRYLITNWRKCVEELETVESVGCHFMRNVGVPPVDNIWPGSFYWVRSDFVATLPPLAECPLVKQFGIKDIRSRATGEHYIGLGPRLPTVKDYLPNGGEGVP